MSNGTRKKVVDFKKILNNDGEDESLKKKAAKLKQNGTKISHKKEKYTKIIPKTSENSSKTQTKSHPKKTKIAHSKRKDQMAISEYVDKLENFKEELQFLNKKRNADISFEKIENYNKISNTAINDTKTKNKKSTNKNNNDNIKNNNIKNNNNTLPPPPIINNNNNSEFEKNINFSENNSTLIADFYKLYDLLFETNRLDNSRPYKFVDYLINGDNILFNIKNDKVKLDEIKRGVLLRQKTHSSIEENLLNKYIYEYLRCDFTNSFMKKLCEKINLFLKEYYTTEIKENNKKDTSILEKKDKFTYSNFLAEKLQKNVNKSCMSFTNDNEYFRSLIYICNKYSSYIGKKEVPEKILIESLEKNKNILDDFKNNETAEKIEKEYLENLLKFKPIRKYMNKKLKFIKNESLENNCLFNELNRQQFKKMFPNIIKNKNDDDTEKLTKLLNEIYFSKNSKNNNDNRKNIIQKPDTKNFIIILKLLLEILINQNKKYISPDDCLENNKLNIPMILSLYNIFNKNIKTEGEEGINNNEINRAKTVKKKKTKTNLGKSENTIIKEKLILPDNINHNDMQNISQNNNSTKAKNNTKNNQINKNSETSKNAKKKLSIKTNNSSSKEKGKMIIHPNNNINDNKNINIINNKNNSKIVQFKVPFSVSNNNSSSNNTNNLNNSNLFEINSTNNTKQFQTENQEQTNNNTIIISSTTSPNQSFNIITLENSQNNKKRGRKSKTIQIKNVENLNDKNMNNVTTEKNSQKTVKSTNKFINKKNTLITINHKLLKNFDNINEILLHKLADGQNIFNMSIENTASKKKSKIDNKMLEENLIPELIFIEKTDKEKEENNSNCNNSDIINNNLLPPIEKIDVPLYKEFPKKKNVENHIIFKNITETENENIYKNSSNNVNSNGATNVSSREDLNQFHSDSENIAVKFSGLAQNGEIEMKDIKTFESIKNPVVFSKKTNIDEKKSFSKRDVDKNFNNKNNVQIDRSSIEISNGKFNIN